MPTSDAPIQIARVAITVKDLPTMIAFYRDAIGLTELSQDGEQAVLGAAGRPLIELRYDPAASRRPAEAGLFHTAFLLPGRASLGAWLRHATDFGVILQGASDHNVSEALYLADPEGNGIEVYADRPRETWHDANGKLHMITSALDLYALANSADAPWNGMPDDGTIGHVHLQVGQIAAAQDFIMGTLGLDLTASLHGASFFSSGGYHHHLAANIWNSSGAGPRSAHSTGLAQVILAADAERLAGPVSHIDPWGTAFALEPKSA